MRILRPLAVAAAVAAFTLAAAIPLGAQDGSPALRITSPLGRTGLPGRIRIVARLDSQQLIPLAHVDFYVDEVLLSSDADGPPYEADWTDNNPFETRELTVRAPLPSGTVLTDHITLKPLEHVEASEVISVAVDASVVDEKGRFMRNVGAADFELYEDGKPQTLDLVSQHREPALFMLLVDSSQSMASRTAALRTTATRLLDPLADEDQVVVAPFTRSILSVTGPTTDRATVLDAIAGIKPSGGTAILDALGQAADALGEGERRKAIVLITDGYDENSESDFARVGQRLQKAGVTLYVVGFGGVAGMSLKGERVLSKMAEDSGGRGWFPRDERQLAFAYDAIAADVQHRYLLTYTPTNQRQDGSYRAIDLKVRFPGTRVRAREGYVAPMAPPVRATLEFTAVGAGQTAVPLAVENLVVFEDGVPQTVDTFHEAVQPVTFMLALDSSGSMKRSAARAQEAAREFVLAMRAEDQLGLIQFASTSNYIHSPTDRRNWTLDAIDKYVADGGTALYDALYDSLSQIADVKGRRVVVVVTDGIDENAASNGPGSEHSWGEVVEKLQQTEAAVYAVGLGSRVDKARLQQLADISGGAAYFPADVASLLGDYSKILEELRRRYVVGYESTNRIRDGQWRKVEIRDKQQAVTVRSRGGYWAPDR